MIPELDDPVEVSPWDQPRRALRAAIMGMTAACAELGAGSPAWIILAQRIVRLEAYLNRPRPRREHAPRGTDVNPHRKRRGKRRGKKKVTRKKVKL